MQKPLKNDSSDQIWLFIFGEDRALISHRQALIHAAIKKGKQVIIATKFTQHRQAIEHLGAQTIDLNIERTGLSLRSEWVCVFEIAKIIRQYQPELVHLLSVKACLLGLLGSLISLKQPVIVMALTGLGFLFLSSRLKIKLLRMCIVKLMALALKILRGFVIVQNQNDWQFAVRSLKVEPRKIALIANAGVDLNRLQKKQSQKGDSKSLIALYMGRYIADKGLFELVEAGLILKEKKCPIKIAIAGQCDLKNPTAIQPEQILNWHQQGLIEDWGFFEHPEDALLKADIAVLASHREGSPKFLAEAAACGLPLVAFDVPGSNMLCRHHATGLLARPFDCQSLADSLMQLALDKDLRLKLGEGAFKMAQNELGVDLINDQTLNFFEIALQSK
ncbi:MAG: glycosyltransferase [Pseudomonadota bacterium]